MHGDFGQSLEKQLKLAKCPREDQGEMEIVIKKIKLQLQPGGAALWKGGLWERNHFYFELL